MDAKETLARLPLTGSLFAILLGITFVLCRLHDQPIQTAVSAYHSQHLLKTEAPIYEDFYSKRLAIERLGSADRLAQFKSAQKNKLDSLISEFILSDRSFQPYLNEKSHLFFSAKEVDQWRNQRQHLEQLLLRLSSYQFALIPEQFKAAPEFSRLFSNLFMETEILNLFSNILCLMILFVLLEAYLIRRRFWAVLFCLGLTHASLYLLFADSLSAPLSGANVVIYFMFGLALTRYLRAYFRSRTAIRLCLSSLISILFIVKALLDIYYQFIFPAQSAGILLAAFTGVILAFMDFIWRPKPQAVDMNITKAETVTDLPADLRRVYQEALTALTRFNFAYARSSLAQLHTQVPESVQLLESRYHLEKLHPGEGHFWPLLKARLEQAIKYKDYSLLCKLFFDMQKNVDIEQESKNLLSPTAYLKIMHIFLEHHNLEKAEQSFNLLKTIADKSTVKQACQLLIEHFARKKLLAKQANYQALYDNL